MVISGSTFGRWGIWRYDSLLEEAIPLSSSQAASWIQEHKTGSPEAFQNRESKRGSLMRSGQNLAFWTKEPMSLWNRKTLGAHSFVKNLPEGRSQGDSRAKGAAFRCKVSPFSISVTKMNMEKIITFKTYLILEHIISTCRKRMLSDGIFPISLIKLLS